MRSRAWGASVELIGSAAHDVEEDIFASPRRKGPKDVELDRQKDWCAPPKKEGAGIVHEEQLSGFSKYVRLDPDQALASIPEQIRDSLASGYGRYSDLFRAMDGDESGTISRREFVYALSMLGLTQPKRHLGLIFDAFDVDGSGELDFQELAKIIGRGEQLAMRTPRRYRLVPPNARQRFASALDGGLTPVDVALPVWAPYRPVELRVAGGPPIAAWEYVLPSAFQGLNRGSGQLALVTLPSSVDVHLERAPTPTHTTFPAGVLKSDLLISTLIAKGFSVLAFQTHALADGWAASTADTHGACLLAALEHIARHRALRYCRLSLFAHGVGASASLVAISRAPSIFESRLHAMVLVEPVDVDGLLTRCVPLCKTPTLLVASDGEDAPAGALALEIARAMDSIGTPCDLLLAGAEDVSSAGDLDALDFLVERAAPLSRFLRSNGAIGRDAVMPALTSPRAPASPRSTQASPRRSPRAGGVSKLPPIA